MKQEITVVSAFFNINRQNWKNFERSEDKYFEFFRIWAKLKNKIIVYVETEHLKKKILEFRKDIGLENKTIVHVVENYKKIAPDLYESIKKTTENNVQKLYRLKPSNPEVWNADYNYIMLLKMWAVQDAVSREETGEMVAWVDFGYNHGGEVISVDSDFNFLWEYDFPDKINLFYIQKPDDRPIFDMVFLMDTYIMGTIIIGKNILWNKFWLLMKKEMMMLNSVGLTDDDQNIILMCYREKPELFNLFESSWNYPMYQFGGEHLKLLKNTSKKNFFKKRYKAIKKLRSDIKFAFTLYKHIRNFKVH